MNCKGKVNFKRHIAIFLVLINLLFMLPIRALAINDESLKIGSNYFGFKLLSQKEIKEINSTAFLFTHIKTGAKLIYLKNEDDNKVFSIGFKTPPTNNTGVNHIIEHSVFCGSKSYPVKDPSLAIGKQSLNTFLNAFTAPDKTIYPVASRNEKDFKNLMGIYLDAVFYPDMIKNPYIFMQEGWHYELDNKNSPLRYNGIVYSEMKGVYSDTSALLNKYISESLFPESIYRWEAGGYPDDILNLKYEELVNTYKKYYNPSNSYIYLYGKLDINKTLEYIDENYLSKIDRKDVNTSISIQKPFNKMKLKIADYPIPKGVSTRNKTYIAYNFITGKVTDKKDIIGLEILKKLLFEMEESPLKNNMWEDGYGVYGQFYNETLQPYFSIISEYTDEEYKYDFVKNVRKNLANISKRGFSKELINTAISSYEKEIKDRNISTNRGVSYNDIILSTWMYDSDPTMYLEYEKEISELRSMNQNQYFKNLINKYFLSNKNNSLVVLRPRPGLEQQNAVALNNKLQNYKSKLNSKQIDELIEKTKKLKEWQEATDTKEALNSIPRLLLSDIDKKAEIIPTLEENIDGVKLLRHDLNTNDLSYIHMYFDLSSIPQDKIKYVYLVAKMLGNIDTKNHTYIKLYNDIEKTMHSINFTPYTVYDYKNPSNYYPKMDVSLTLKDSNMEGGIKLLDEIINSSNVKDKKHLHELIQQEISNFEDGLSENVQDVIQARLTSYFSNMGKYDEIGSIDYYNFLCYINKNFNKDNRVIINNINDVMKLMFNKNNMIVSFTGRDEQYEVFKEKINPFLNALRANNSVVQNYKFNNIEKNEGFIIPSKVQYITKGYDFTKLGYRYTGSMKVLQNILNNEYLWKNVRVKGGAYGSDVWISSSGYVEFSSYRDPNLKESIDIFNKAPEFIRNFNATDEEMASFIIGTIGAIDTPKTVNEKALIADRNYISGRTYEDIQRERDEILNTKPEDIRKLADMISDVLKQNCYTVIGNESKIKENKGIFGKIKYIIND